MARRVRNSVSFEAQQRAQKARMELGVRFGNFSMAEFTAQRHVHEMVEILVGIAKDPTVDIGLRRQCANDVIERADGKVALKVSHTRGKDKEEMARIASGGEANLRLENEAAEALAEAELLSEGERWISSGVDPSLWPAKIQRKFGPQSDNALQIDLGPLIDGDAL